MPELQIRCPNTGAVVGTGIVMEAEELDAMSTTDVTLTMTRCSSCGETHDWSKSDVVR